DLLAHIWVLDPVPAWTASGSELKRLQSGPKHHLVDPALAVRLLGMTHESLLDGKGAPIGPQEGTLLGSLFESLVTLCVRVPAQTAEAEVRHLRTRNGDHEIDLILRSEEHTSELQSRFELVCRLLLEKKKDTKN